MQTNNSPKNRRIIPNITPCCSDMPQCSFNEEQDYLCLDGDCVNLGDMLVCPVHNDTVLFYFTEENWFGKYDFFNKLNLVKCKDCNKMYKLDVWSYDG
jgi:hypothetical protein